MSSLILFSASVSSLSCMLKKTRFFFLDSLSFISDMLELALSASFLSISPDTPSSRSFLIFWTSLRVLISPDAPPSRSFLIFCTSPLRVLISLFIALDVFLTASNSLVNSFLISSFFAPIFSSMCLVSSSSYSHNAYEPSFPANGHIERVRRTALDPSATRCRPHR